jgi:D-methionine transport system substrate-binding protein
VRDIAEAYRSKEFLAITETKFAGFVKTDYQQALASK